MYIKEVSIEGFKSYAQRVTLSNFDPGFNAITGLNGSGKSNILDSICFVMGIKNLAHVSRQPCGPGGRRCMRWQSRREEKSRGVRSRARARCAQQHGAQQHSSIGAARRRAFDVAEPVSRQQPCRLQQRRAAAAESCCRSYATVCNRAGCATESSANTAESPCWRQHAHQHSCTPLFQTPNKQ